MKVALLELTPELFVDFCKASKNGPPRRFEVVENALPDDAEVSAIAHMSDPLRLHHGTVLLHIKSESFADVPEGGFIPKLPPIMFRTVEDPPEAKAAG